MEPGESSYSEQRRRFPAALLAGVVVMLALFGGVYLLTSTLGSHSQGPVVKLPFGPAEQTYAERIHFNDIRMSRSTNMLKQEFTYITGAIANDGVQNIRALEVTVEFHDSLDQVILRDTEVLISGQTDAPLPAGQRRDFQIMLEHVPAEWNQQYPSISVTGLVLD
ncbi:MAG: FxLYD domain-containing protein [Candidatus Acidiferrales bacterium]